MNGKEYQWKPIIIKKSLQKFKGTTKVKAKEAKGKSSQIEDTNINGMAK